MDKVDKIIIIAFIIFMIILIYLFIDFYNDYKCSTRDSEYFKTHNCERYLKWKQDILKIIINILIL